MPNSFLNWEEKRFTCFSHSLRIYIYGVEVSAWVKGSVNVTYASRDSYNTASFELANPRGIWQVMPNNLNPFIPKKERFRKTEDMFSEAAKSRVMFLKKKASVVKWDLDVKSSNNNVIETGTRKGLNSSIYTDNPYTDVEDNIEEKYRLLLNDCIFNKNDPVRIFSKNPFSKDYDEWYEVFCGFVQEHPITTNYLRGESTVRIGASCIKQQLQKMRVNINNHTATLDPSPIVNESFYQDFISDDIKNHPFAVSSLENAIKTLILGTPNPPRDPAYITEWMTKRKVGTFKLGNIVCYDPNAPEDTLERWHLMTVFGVNLKPFPKAGDNLWLSTAQMQRIGRHTLPSLEADAVVGGPTSRYLHMLLPSSGTGPGTLITHDVMKGGQAADAREWTTRWEVIRDLASKIDFQVLTSPSGDILVEFPQYGFNPCAYLTNFGNGPGPTVETTSSAANAAKESQAKPLAGSSKSLPKGFKKAWAACQSQSWASRKSIAKFFIFTNHIKEETLNDEAEDFPTILQVSGGLAFTPLNNEQKLAVLKMKAYIWSPALVDRYGVISESVDFPFAGQRGKDLENNSSTILKRLKQLGLIEFTKRMANASTWQGSLVYRPFMFPNRPIQLHRTNRCGLQTNVSYQWNIGQSASLTVGCHMLMSKRHDHTWRLMTGSTNTPVDYGAIWSTTDTSAPAPGVKAKGGDEASKDAKTQQAETPADEKSAKNTSSGENNPPDKKVKNSTAGLDGLYPPFKTLIENLLGVGDEIGLSLTISSIVRNQDYDRVLAQKNKAIKPKTGFTSLHNLGLAIDMVPTADPKGFANRPAWVAPMTKLYDAYKKKYPTSNELLIWGGSSRTFSHQKGDPAADPDDHRDLVHFEAPRAWFAHGGATALANFYQGKKGSSEEEAKQKVWKAITSHVPALAQPGLATLPAEELAQAEKVLTNPSGEPAAAQSELGNVASGIPASCSLLTKAGLT